MAQNQYVEVAVGLPLAKTFHYQVPTSLRDQMAVGKRVWVPFRNRQILGFVVGFPKRPEVPHVRPIAKVVDEEPVVDGEMLALTRWVAETYHAGWGETILGALPGPLRRGRFTMESRLQEEVPLPPARSAPLSLTPEQERAVGAILEAFQQKRHEVFLLHGITASGKTEVYLQVIEKVLAQGQSSIVLVPEIALTPQTVDRFQARFGMNEVAVLHSAMLESERLRQWHRIRLGEAKVVVGARSAIFAPVRSLGLVVLDEEHEPSYKQEGAPRYHAREVAIERCRIARTPVVLGSATPSLESYHKARRGTFRLLTLPQRVEELTLPQVDVVDMRREMETKHRHPIFSRLLEDALNQTLKEGSQAILFLNRRGFSTFVQCVKCGHVVRCANCQVTLTYHIAEKSLVCHYCHAAHPAPSICPKCQGDYIRFRGTGTERVESGLARIFPQARMARMDTDSMKPRGSHAKVLQAFRQHEIDILIGTQMVAKGHDFPKVTLVGVIAADTALNLPDFRSAERTFHLLTQVAGRAGRGKLPGRVVVQTYAPHHYAILCASRHDYEAFYDQEIEIRKEVQLPPFTRLIQLVCRSQKDEKAFEAAGKIARLLRDHGMKGVALLGPSPHSIRRLRRQYRWQLILKGSTLEKIQVPLKRVLEKYRPPRGCYLAVDVDPL